MCTPSQKLPFGSRSIEIASSKSRACSPSIVTVGHVAEVRAALRCRVSRTGRAQPPSLRRSTASRVRVGQAVLADDDRRVHTRRVDRPEHLRHAAERRPRRRRPPRDFGRDHLAGRRAARVAFGHLHVHRQASIERHHEARARGRPPRSGRPRAASPRSRMRTMRPSARAPSRRCSTRTTTRSPCMA